MTTTDTTYPSEPALARAAIDEFAQTTKRLAGVPSARARLVAVKDQLDKSVAALIDAIDPVLARQGSPLMPGEDVAPMPGSADYSDHANWLHAQAAEIEHLVARVEAIIGRVDL